MPDRYHTIVAQIYQAQQALDHIRQSSGRGYREVYWTTTEGRRYDELRQIFANDYEGPLLRSFRHDQQPQVDAAIALLEVGIPARGLCYSRTWLLTRLKRTALTPAQQQRLRDLAITICTTRSLGYCRSAFLRLCRLMIQLADPAMIEQLRTLASRPDALRQTSAKRMLTVILHGRLDLRAG
jgi:hypothetical protein